MCIPTQKLQLCTCSKSDLEKAPHSWELFRYNKTKQDWVVGLIEMPYDFDMEQVKLAEYRLLDMLNEGTCFDFKLECKTRDRLALHFNSGKEERISFGYEYRKGKWVVKEYDYFNWQDRYDVEDEGCIKTLD